MLQKYNDIELAAIYDFICSYELQQTVSIKKMVTYLSEEIQKRKSLIVIAKVKV
jgi:hypothetical protein